MNFDTFLDNLIQFIEKEIALYGLNSSENLFLIIEKSQKFILNVVSEVNIESKESESLIYEKIAQILNKIEDIVEYQLLEKYNLYKNLNSMKILFTENIEFYLLKNFLEDIKNQTKCKGSYLADSSNTIRDITYNKTFEQYIHATSNVNTVKGQGKLLFYPDVKAHKNIYIINTILKNGYQGSLINNSTQKNLINLLPFISMISKITTNGSKKSIHENIYYFFKTPLIIIGDNIWKDYNEIMYSFYSVKKLEEHQWFYTEHFEKNDETKIFNSLMKFLKQYTIDIIQLINIDKINNKIQENEEIILQQLHNLILSIIFFDKEYNIVDNDYIKLTSKIIDKIKYFDSEYKNINLKNINFNSHIKISTDIMREELIPFYNIFSQKTHFEIVNLDKENLNFYNFTLDVGRALGFSRKYFDFLKNNKYGKLKDIITKEKFGNILSVNFFNHVNESLQILTKLIFVNYPTFGKKMSSIKFKAKEDKENFYLLFFYIVSYLSNSSDFFKNFKTQNIEDFAGDYSYIEKFKDDEFSSWKIFLTSEMLFPQNKLEFDIKEDIMLKEIIYKYTFFYNLENHTSNYFLNLKKNPRTDHMLTNHFDVLENYFNNDENIFKAIIEVNKHYNPIPVEYAKALIEIMGPYIMIKFIKYLNNIDDISHLKESLLWFLSNKYLDINIV